MSEKKSNSAPLGAERAQERPTWEQVSAWLAQNVEAADGTHCRFFPDCFWYVTDTRQGGYCSSCAAAVAALAVAPVVAQEPGWQPMERLADDAEFIIGAWAVGDGTNESGELAREGPYWFDINGDQHKPFCFMELPDPPSSPSSGSAHEKNDTTTTKT